MHQNYPFLVARCAWIGIVSARVDRAPEPIGPGSTMRTGGEHRNSMFTYVSHDFPGFGLARSIPDRTIGRSVCDAVMDTDSKKSPHVVNTVVQF